MARPTITPEKRARMRSEIRSAAIRVIRRLDLAPGDARGYEQVTVRDVIQEADISIGTFYKYFKNREDLGQSLWAEPVEELKSTMQADYDSAADPREKIRTLLDHYVRFSVDNRRVFRGAFLFVRPDNHPAPEQVDLRNEMFYRNLCAAFEEGQDQGVFRQFDPHEMAKVFWAAIHGSLALPINLDRFDFDSPEALSSNMIDALLGMIELKA